MQCVQCVYVSLLIRLYLHPIITIIIVARMNEQAEDVAAGLHSSKHMQEFFHPLVACVLPNGMSQESVHFPIPRPRAYPGKLGVLRRLSRELPKSQVSRRLLGNRPFRPFLRRFSREIPKSTVFPAKSRNPWFRVVLLGNRAFPLLLLPKSKVSSRFSPEDHGFASFCSDIERFRCFCPWNLLRATQMEARPAGRPAWAFSSKPWAFSSNFVGK